MSNEPQIQAVLKIGILDSSIKGIIYLVDFKNKKASLCHCRGLSSPVFIAEDETDAYHQSRDWFMNNFDGFVQVAKLEGQEETLEMKNFDEFKDAFQ